MKKIFVFIALFTISPNAQSDFSTGIDLGGNIPVSKFDKLYSFGYGGDAHFLYHVGNQAIFSFSVGYHTWPTDQDAFNNKAEELGLNWRFEIESDFKIIPVLLGVRWYFLKGKKSLPYIIFEGGLYHYMFTLSGKALNTIPNADIPEIALPDISESGTETMINLGAGYLIKLGKHWYLDLAGKYFVLTNAFALNEPVDPENSDAIYGVKGLLQFVHLMAGINYRF
ncbi:MAG: outer membrane beta-barrel protein [Nitrososphaeraceae archaeon]|nr:outer membrane beta-barrel protein [Nitrososphaeraceae archaeon]